jgi:pumilio family protein 6
MAEYVDHKHARHVLLQLLSPDCTRYFPPAVMELMHPPKRTMMVAATAGAGADSDEVRGGKGVMSRRDRGSEGGRLMGKVEGAGRGREQEL